mmetsp:Transcript_6057/g.15451  ORF Transcript_6057/g.15451 Transcript_6057/m.15451 type:complete len:367 (+) Transcript_6057:228-1328(+)
MLDSALLATPLRLVRRFAERRYRGCGVRVVDNLAVGVNMVCQLSKRRRCDGRRRRVAVGQVGQRPEVVLQVKIRDVIRKCCEAVDPEVGKVLRDVQIERGLCVPVHHGEAVDGPCLPASPRGAVDFSTAVAREAFGARLGIVTHNVMDGKIGANVVRCSGVGMMLGDVDQSLTVLLGATTAVVGVQLQPCKHEQLEVHHVVYDDREIALRAVVCRPCIARLIGVPAQRAAHRGVVALRERHGRVEENRAVYPLRVLVCDRLITEPERVVDDEPYIVRSVVVLVDREPSGVFAGYIRPCCVAGEPPEVPVNGGPEAGHPGISLGELPLPQWVRGLSWRVHHGRVQRAVGVHAVAPIGLRCNIFHQRA